MIATTKLRLKSLPSFSLTLQFSLSASLFPTAKRSSRIMLVRGLEGMVIGSFAIMLRIHRIARRGISWREDDGRKIGGISV